MRDARLDEFQAGIKTGGRNINSLRYADDASVMAESKEELKNLLSVKEESERTSLRLNIKKIKIMASSPISYSWALKSLWMVTAHMKSEDDCFLAGKL